MLIISKHKDNALELKMFYFFKRNAPNLIDMRNSRQDFGYANNQIEVAKATLWAWGDPRITTQPVLAKKGITFKDLMPVKQAEEILFP